MAKATLKYKPVVPAKAELELVTLELTPDEASYLKIYLGHAFPAMRKEHMKQATNKKTFEKFYQAGSLHDLGSDIYTTLARTLGIDQHIED